MTELATEEEILNLLRESYPDCLHRQEMEVMLKKRVWSNALATLRQGKLAVRFLFKIKQLSVDRRTKLQEQLQKKFSLGQTVSLWQASYQAIMEDKLENHSLPLEESLYVRLMTPTARHALLLVKQGRTVKGIVAGLKGRLTVGKTKAIQQVYDVFEALLGAGVLDYSEDGLNLAGAKITRIKNLQALQYLQMMALAGSWAEVAIQQTLSWNSVPEKHIDALNALNLFPRRTSHRSSRALERDNILPPI